MTGYFSPNLKKITALTGHDRELFNIKIDDLNNLQAELKTIYQGEGNQITENISELIKSISILLLKQSHSDRNNPYVEHQHFHSIRVSKIIIKLLNFFAEHKPESIQDLKETYNIKNENDLRFILITVGLLHDCNYFVNQQNGEIKAIHALKSALSAYQNIDLVLKRILQEKGFQAADSESVTRAFYDAIYCHNGDKKECKFRHLMSSPIGDISFENKFKLQELITTCLDLNMSHIFLNQCTCHQQIHDSRNCQKEAYFGIRYEEANDEHNQLLYLLRLADNFDSTQERLLSVQRNALNKLLPHAKTFMEKYFEVPSQFHIGSWPWFAIFESSKLYVEFTTSEYNTLEKIIINDKNYKPGVIKANS
ncbi:MAG: hypothetical protein VXX85_04020, partial [Candidatus Margulisiibacteriota bacterium]|nr:hypothetical protein [Candidatus Margulisiibacteriota bacterium]